jgi:hypothetical protein
MTEPVLAAFQSRVWPAGSDEPSGAPVTGEVRIDASSRLLGMWED